MAEQLKISRHKNVSSSRCERAKRNSDPAVPNTKPRKKNYYVSTTLLRCVSTDRAKGTAHEHTSP